MEVILKLRIQPRVLSIQSPAQRGFTAKTSPLNTSFIIEELKRNAKDEKDILIIILLDAKSASDVVNPEHLMRRLYHTGISNKIWTLIYSLHCNATSAIKWKGDISTFFDIKQGVKQGGILSADLYKIYVNSLLKKIINTGIGSKVGDIICNTSACADDVTINATTESEAQILLDIAADFAKQERYELQPSKANTIRIKPSNRTSKGKPTHPLKLNGSDIPEVEEATHIGLKQTDLISKTAEVNVENNIKKARRATYSLMASSLHGQNGLDPEKSLQLVKTYILPILLGNLFSRI